MGDEKRGDGECGDCRCPVCDAWNLETSYCIGRGAGCGVSFTVRPRRFGWLHPANIDRHSGRQPIRLLSNWKCSAYALKTASKAHK